MMKEHRAVLGRDANLRIEIGDNVLAGRYRLLHGRDLHQLSGGDRAMVPLQRDYQIPPLLFELNKR